MYRTGDALETSGYRRIRDRMRFKNISHFWESLVSEICFWSMESVEFFWVP